MAFIPTMPHRFFHRHRWWSQQKGLLVDFGPRLFGCLGGFVGDAKTTQFCWDFFRIPWNKDPVIKEPGCQWCLFYTNEAWRWNWQKSSCQAAGVLLLMHVSARKSKTAHKGHGEKALDADALWVLSFCVTMCFLLPFSVQVLSAKWGAKYTTLVHVQPLKSLPFI